ncbi:NAD/NADP octopine/nopaline dehydrogenase family protein [Variovorax sp. PBL-E5]|uniref:NAD/NADP octopine/nopaline dehydrogenase family protein n=1 Tax=Variovorax sp. PBL-E5 TaxID=434014 RepID=UPI001317A190|nr:NAD/NADP octopine/nopaline dehydrogenase family protein [Variovorax sp. PBL-E5]VTU36051.1 Opine dehydrogenase [Variovorax sp. PBL-E5]
MKISILGAGAGGAAAVAELTLAGHEVVLWNRSPETLAPFQALGGVRYEGVLGEGMARPRLITADLASAIQGVDAAVVTLPTFSHAPVARALAAAGWPANRPVVLNPGHTGGALEFAEAWRSVRADLPPIAEFSTLTYVARKYQADGVTVTGRARQVRAAALPGGDAALTMACRLFPGASPVGDVLASALANANLVLHPPGAVLGAAWVEATQGDFTFYVQAMTPGVSRTMHALDDERLAVAAAFGHQLPNLIEEMKLIGTVESSVTDTQDFRAAIAGGEANKRIKGPDSLQHRYYREDFGHGLLPFLELAAIAGVAVPVARSLFTLAQALVGIDYAKGGRTAEAMGIAGLSKSELLQRVRQQP